MADPKPTIRCSALPILDKCMGMLGAEMTIDQSSEVAEIGTEVHAYAARMIREGQAPDTMFMDPEIGFLVNAARQAWESIRGDYTDPQVEQHMSFDLPKFLLSGHPDLYSLSASALRVLDFKSGYNAAAEVLPQLLGYAYLVLANHQEVRPGTVCLQVAWLRDRDIQDWTFSVAQVREWMRDLHKRAAGWNGRDFTAGEHCRYCPRFHDCPARSQLARSAVVDLMALDSAPKTRGELAPRMPDLYAKVQLLERLIAAFRDWLREDLTKHGSMDCGGGKILQLGTRERAILDVRRGWKIFRGALDDDELADCLSISKTALLNAVAAKSMPRMKAKDKAAIMLALEEAGAVTLRHERFIQWTGEKPEEKEA